MWLWILYNQYGAMIGIYKALKKAEADKIGYANSTIRGNFFALGDFHLRGTRA